MRRRLPTSIKRPRREWWSLAWARRCSVSSLIRSVSSATWTSAEPVSLSPRPYLPISSLFFSLVRLISLKSRAPGGSRPLESSTDAPGVLDVPVHLLDQLVDLVVGALAAEALDEGDAEGLAVE